MVHLSLLNISSDKGPVTAENLAASKKAEEEKEQWKKDNPLPERMAKLADASANGAATGKGLANIGAEIAGKVNKVKKDGEKLSVSPLLPFAICFQVQQVAKDV